MSALWSVGEIVRVVAGRCALSALEQESTPITSVSIDSRTLTPGALYVAIQGVAQDGHKFVEAAFRQGATAALVRGDFSLPDMSMGVLIHVEDPLAAMTQLGRAARARTGAKVIAVTGSAGKTGTKEALALMLGGQGGTHASVKSFNNHWGVPLTLARMAAETDFGVFEVGMNHAGEITPLSQMIEPDVALITTVAPVHIGHFSSEEEIADAKAEIFAGLKVGGTAVLPADNPHYERLLEQARLAGVSRVVGFGQAAGAEARLIAGQFGPEGSFVEADILGDVVRFDLPQPGAHIAMNFIGALAAVQLVGGDVFRAAADLKQLKAPEGRGVRSELPLPGGRALLIDESYNANPASMRIALEGLGQLKGEAYCRRIAVLGDMLELGARSEGYHNDLAPLIADAGIDLVFASGPFMKGLYDLLPVGVQGGYQETSVGLLEMVEKNLRAGDVIMIKGSLGSEMGRVVEHLKRTFSE